MSRFLYVNEYEEKDLQTSHGGVSYLPQGVRK